MFTGLIQRIGTLVSTARHGAEAELKIAADFPALVLGESIAVLGACLSVTSFAPGSFTAFASAETLAKTTLGRLPAGSKLNLERALVLGDALGGHLVSGHVDAVVRLLERTRIGAAERLSFALPEAPLDAQIAAKGSVAIDGISLTVNEVGRQSFEVMVIPLTLNHTTLGATKPGDLVNIETDVLAKYVARQLNRGQVEKKDIDLELLARAGFMR